MWALVGGNSIIGFMKIKASKNSIPLFINSDKKMARLTFIVDGANPATIEFAPSYTIPWVIGNIRFEFELELCVYGSRGDKIADSDLEID